MNEHRPVPAPPCKPSERPEGFACRCCGAHLKAVRRGIWLIWLDVRGTLLAQQCPARGPLVIAPDDGTVVIHDLGDFAVCRSMVGPGDPGPWRDAQQPAHGTVVTCAVCGRLGIAPDPGYLADFLPREVTGRGS